MGCKTQDMLQVLSRESHTQVLSLKASIVLTCRLHPLVDRLSRAILLNLSFLVGPWNSIGFGSSDDEGIESNNLRFRIFSVFGREFLCLN
jgi:hypothetical protein